MDYRDGPRVARLELALDLGYYVRRFGPDGPRFTGKGERRFPSRPLEFTADGRCFRAFPSSFPLPDNSVEQMYCEGVLELVRDDVGLLAECARVLAPGGELVLAVPATGPLAGLDAMNLYKYLGDVTHRGAPLPETHEVGWRRHYSIADIVDTAGGAFVIERTERSRIITAELLHIVALMRFRWWRRDDARYHRVRRQIDLLAAKEGAVRVPAGFILRLELTKPHQADRAPS